MKVTFIAGTCFYRSGYESVTDWVPTGKDEPPASGDSLVEFAGRACYQSWHKPNPKTALNEDYIAHILEVGHESVLEHASATFYIEGVSRSLTHELVRHRHLSFSQLSQRFVDESHSDVVMHPALRVLDDSFTEINWEPFHQNAKNLYDRLVVGLQIRGLSSKQAREAARAVLPNATETKIVVTGNYRAWRHFIKVRSAPGADAEIQELAVEILRQLKGIAPNSFQDLGDVWDD